MIDIQSSKFTFSGHDTFQCRQLWLKKGYDFVSAGKSFNEDDAIASLGVGKNMVSSIRYWLRAFNIITTKDQITELGKCLLDDNGWDPFLEDEASLWLLHYQLLKNNFASIYSLIFNDFRRERFEFTKDTFVGFIKRKSEVTSGMMFNQNTIESDFDVFRKMYLSNSEDSKNVEDGFSGLLCNLNLVKAYKKEKYEYVNGKEKRTRTDALYIENEERPSLPLQMFLYAIVDNENYGKSISLTGLEHDYNSPGTIFALNRSALLEKIEDITEKYEILYNDHAGKTVVFFILPEAA